MEFHPPAAVLTALILMLIFSTAEMTGVRLVDSDDHCSGTPEILFKGEWRRVDNEKFDHRNAIVICKELDCGSAVNVTFHRSWDKNVTISVTCKGTESNVSQCNSFEQIHIRRLTHRTVLICSDSVRLVDGAGLCSGRVEVKSQKSWTTVCETDFDWKDAEVACRELSCGTPLTLQGALFGEGEHPFGDKEFQCKGTEKNLLTCRTSARREHTCTHGSAVGLTCAESDDLRLVDGSSRCAGKVEMFYGGEWMNVYAEEWSVREAEVVCKKLNCGSALTAPWMEDSRLNHNRQIASAVACKKPESALKECSFKNVEYSQTKVICSDSVRLVDGAGLCSGRVEVKSQKSWTTVCETDFDWKDAEVVCRELSCGTPLTLQGALFGEGEHPFGDKEFQCKGTETSLLTCSISAREEQTCTHGRAIELTCSGPNDVRLVDGISRCAGTVEVFFKGEWRRVHGHFHYSEMASVLCRQLDCGSAVAATQIKSESNTPEPAVWFVCTGFESVVSECTYFTDTRQVDKIGVICSDLLEQPTISLSTPIRVSRGLQGSEVFRGHSFTITCSTQPQYPGGSFQLILPWNNRSHTQTAVNHSASFLFSAAEDSLQGNYRCVYENQVTFQSLKISLVGVWTTKDVTHNFSTESEPLHLTVTDSPLPLVITRILLVPFLLFTSCLLIFLILKKCGHIFIRNTSGKQGAAAAVQYELVSLQQHVERRFGEEPTDLEQEEEEAQPGVVCS